jgi:glucosylglycerate synthase
MKAFEENPAHVKKADIVVGIPTLNKASLIGFPALQSALGLKEHFGHLDSVIINCDNSSTDGTAAAFMNCDTQGIPKICLSTPKGVKGKGNNIKTLFRKVLELDAKAVIVLDATLKSMNPRWIKTLGEPLFKDFAFVSPLYVRHKYDGSITNDIAYPLTRCLYGRRVRQPAAGDCAFSGSMAGAFLRNEHWNEDASQYGIDIWMTTIAMNEGVPICQAFMGKPKVSEPKDPSFDPGPAFRQTMNTIFSLMNAYHDKWKTTKWSKPTAIFGFGSSDVEMPVPMAVNREKLYQRFREGFNTHWETYRSIFSSENLQKIREVASLSVEHFEMPVQVWAKTLFDFAICAHKKTVDRGRMLEVLIPLYYGMTLSYANKTEGMSVLQAEEFIEDMCLIFEQTKPYIIDRWG